MIAIIADDLSSATDCGVQMLSGGFRVVVPLQSCSRIPEGVDVISFHTDSRAMSGKDAYRATKACLRDRALSPPTVFYKSVDSTLRGNPGAEIDAILDSGFFDAAVVAPAFPTYGRTTTAGCQFVHGVPLDETEFASDPTMPVTTSSIAGRIAEQCSRPATSIALEAQCREQTVLYRLIEDQLRRGVQIFIFDAETEDDLEKIAMSAAALPYRLLWVGSTGLSRYVPKAIGLSPGSRPSVIKVKSGSVLIVAGSASERTRDQLNVFDGDENFCEIQISALSVASGGKEARAEISRAQHRLGLALAENIHMIALTLTSSRSEISEASTLASARGMAPEKLSAILVDTLGRLTANAVGAGAPIMGLVLTGGDTANALMVALGADLIEIIEEVEPGIPLGLAMGQYDTLIVTKAGGFGSEMSLVKSVQRIEAYAGE
ncbi:four-carbon acid sugar kinase family protein [Gammaproteobacteria bacterium]|nr:four-carbon acid sugar kinase family protein [Gammaproteobacteria bacterium]